MVFRMKIRNAKTKGSQFELDVEFNLKKIYPNMKRLGGEGQYREIDLVDETNNIAIECKRHNKLSDKAIHKYFYKLKKRAGIIYEPILIYKEDYQPVKCACLTYFSDLDIDCLITFNFEERFGVKFNKHKFKKNK